MLSTYVWLSNTRVIQMTQELMIEEELGSFMPTADQERYCRAVEPERLELIVALRYQGVPPATN
jgi:hypothetical protein